jgi:hypothetical protein
MQYSVLGVTSPVCTAALIALRLSASRRMDEVPTRTFRRTSRHEFRASLQVGRPAVLTPAHTPLERGGAGRLLRDCQHFLARAQRFLNSSALRDVAANAVVAVELALGVEDRRTAGADVAQGPVCRRPGILEVAERPARREHLPVLGPAARERQDAGKLPARLADRRSSGVAVGRGDEVVRTRRDGRGRPIGPLWPQ